MTPDDLQHCRQAIQVLTSSEHSHKNYLFLEPVDTSFFPTYTQIIHKPMDLGTLATNLEAGSYSSRDEFFADAMLCFENAIRFHSDKPENHWIVKLAKDMIKVVQREKKKGDKKASSGGKGGVDSETSNLPKMLLALKVKKSHSPQVSLPLLSPSSASVIATVAEETMNQPIVSANAGKEVDSSLEVSLSQPTLIKQQRERKKVTAVKAKPSQAKLKLGLSLSTKRAALASVAVTSDSTSKNVALSKAKPIKGLTSPPSRGKQLPAALNSGADTASKDATISSYSAPGGSSVPPAVPKIRLSLSRTSSVASVAASTTSTALSTDLAGGVAPKNQLRTLPLHSKAVMGKTSTVDGDSGAYATSIEPSSARKSEIDRTSIMTPNQHAQCTKVLSALKLRYAANASWFLKPVNDPRLLEDYKAKISNPIDLGTIGIKYVPLSIYGR